MTEAATGGGLRALRLAAFGLAATSLAVGAHLAGGGTPPAAAATALVGLLCAVAGGMLARRRRGLLDILVVLAAVQVAAHEVLAAAAAGAPGGVPMDGMTGMSVDGMPTDHASGPLMLVAHAVAVSVTAILLARGERLVHDLTAALARAGARVARRLRRGGARCEPVVPARVRVPVLLARTGLSLVLVRHLVARRGPPRQAC